MAIQSHATPVPLLLTRPAAQGGGFAQTLQHRFGPRLCVIKTPLMAPRFFSDAVPAAAFEALILTSQTTVAALRQMPDILRRLPQPVFCVGDQTATMARALGLRPEVVAPDVAGLIARIKAARPDGKLLLLRGRDARGDVAEHLVSAGIETVQAVVYAQDAVPLTADAVRVLRLNDPVIVPLFSARTAALFTAERLRIGGVAPVCVAAISDAVALEAQMPRAQITVSATPDAAGMADAVNALLMALDRA